MFLLARILLFYSVLEDLGQLLRANVAVMVFVEVQESFPHIVVVALQLLLQIVLQLK